MHTRGFTLLELLVSLVIICLIMTIGLPSFSSQVQNTRTKTATLKLLDAVQLTRSKAVFTNNRAVLKNNMKWEDGWEIFVDKNDNGLREESEELIQSQEKLSNVRIVPNFWIKKYVSFIGSGESRFTGKADSGGFQAGTFTVCPIAKGSGYTLVLARGGRMRMSEISEEQCGNTL